MRFIYAMKRVLKHFFKIKKLKIQFNTSIKLTRVSLIDVLNSVFLAEMMSLNEINLFV